MSTPKSCHPVKKSYSNGIFPVKIWIPEQTLWPLIICIANYNVQKEREKNACHRQAGGGVGWWGSGRETRHISGRKCTLEGWELDHWMTETHHVHYITFSLWFNLKKKSCTQSKKKRINCWGKISEDENPWSCHQNQDLGEEHYSRYNTEIYR